ncbi:hypothetical protein MN608_11879 [Microdochium nivale]|nr:hypothetical protein MN608_11879 [Microdochium nivale]
MINALYDTCCVIRGNHFVSIRHLIDHTATDPQIIEAAGMSGLNQSPGETVTAVARMVDDHLAMSEVQPGSHRMSSLHIPAPDGNNNNTSHKNITIDDRLMTVKIGDVFELAVTSGRGSSSSPPADGQHGFALLRGEIGDGAVVVCTSKFYAATEGQTNVFVYAAHHATLAPGFFRCRVRVVPAASAAA